MPNDSLSRQLLISLAAKGMSVREASRQLNCRPNTLGQWLRGQHRPRVQHLRSIAEFCEIPIATIVQMSLGDEP